MAYSNDTKSSNTNSTREFKGGLYKTSIESIGTPSDILGENGEVIGQENKIIKGKYGFELEIKFANSKFKEKIFFPYGYFKLDLSEDRDNYFNDRAFKVNDIIVANSANEKRAISNYVDKYVMWMTDLMSVYVPNARAYTYAQLKRCKLISPLFNFYGFSDGDTFTSNEEFNGAEPTSKQNGEYVNYYGNIDGKPVYLQKYEESGYTYYYTPVDLSSLDQDTHMEFMSAAVNGWVECFLNSCIKGVEEYNKGQKGYTVNTFQENKGKWFLKPVTSLKSLVVSLSKVKIGDKYETVTQANHADYPQLKSFWYGGMLGLDSMGLSFKENDEYVNRLQFVFRGKEHRLDIEGLDSLVTYRNKSNPKLNMEKPIVEEQEDIDEAFNTEMDELGF